MNTNAITNAVEAVDLTALSLDEVLANLNEATEVETAETLKAYITEAIKNENKEALALSIETFAHTAHRDPALFWEAFIEEPKSPTRKLVQSEETGEWTIEAGNGRRICFCEVDAKYQEEYKQTMANSPRYVGMLGRFVHNLYSDVCDGLKVTEKGVAPLIKVTYKGTEEVKVEEYDFSGHSVKALTDQLNAIVKTIMPEGGALLMRGADVRYIREGYTKAKEGKVTTAKERIVMNLIFDALKVRKGGNAYVIESKAKIHADKK